MLVTCINCESQFNKAPSQIKRHPNNFCSRSCSASYNNRLHPKRTKISYGKCAVCKKPISRNSKSYCSHECNYLDKYNKNVKAWLETGECKLGGHPNHYVRKYLKDQQGYKCAICGLGEIWNN